MLEAINIAYSLPNILHTTSAFAHSFTHSFMHACTYPTILQKGMNVDGSSWNNLLTNW